MNRTSASGLERALKCNASLRLPVIDSTSEYAERGTWRHHFLARIGSIGRDKALAEIPADHRDACAALPVDDLPTNLAVEVSFGWDIQSSRARVIGTALDRDYGDVADSEIVGTADCVGVDDQEGAIVIEWKSAGNKQTAKGSIQLRILALMVAMNYRREWVEVRIYRLSDDGGVWSDKYTYDIFELAEFAGELRKWYARSKTGDATPSQGPWCTYCRSFNFCPANTSLIQIAAKGVDVSAPFAVGLSRETVGAAHSLSQQLRAVANELDRRVASAVLELGPCPTPRGTTLQSVVVDGNERIDGGKAHALISAELGEDVADDCVGALTMTKKSLNDGIKKHCAKGAAKYVASILDELRKRGAVTRSKSQRIIEVGGK